MIFYSKSLTFIKPYVIITVTEKLQINVAG